MWERTKGAGAKTWPHTHISPTKKRKQKKRRCSVRLEVHLPSRVLTFSTGLGSRTVCHLNAYSWKREGGDTDRVLMAITGRHWYSVIWAWAPWFTTSSKEKRDKIETILVNLGGLYCTVGTTVSGPITPTFDRVVAIQSLSHPSIDLGRWNGLSVEPWLRTFEQYSFHSRHSAGSASLD